MKPFEKELSVNNYVFFSFCLLCSGWFGIIMSMYKYPKLMHS